MMLKDIMDQIGPEARPSDYFDLIAGTSTGGLIAIMLSRLGYTVEEAIKKFDEVGPQIFSKVQPKQTWLASGMRLVDKGPAEKAFQKIGLVNGKDGMMISEGSNRCKARVQPDQ
jgi:hypothetical protein